MRKEGGTGMFSRVGFTLIETILAVGILTLIIGGVMSGVSACLQSAELLRQERMHQEQCAALHSLLLRSLMELPADVVLRCASGDARNNEPPPLRLRSRRPALNLTSTQWPASQTCESVVAWRRQANGLLTLEVGTVPGQVSGFVSADTFSSAAAAWVPLVRELKGVQMRFYDYEGSRWVTSWEREDLRPSIVEVNMEFAESPVPFHGVFWIPCQRVVTQQQNVQENANGASPNGGQSPSANTPAGKRKGGTS